MHGVMEHTHTTYSQLFRTGSVYTILNYISVYTQVLSVFSDNLYLLSNFIYMKTDLQDTTFVKHDLRYVFSVI